MIKLWLDCDGVILNTIDKTKEWMIRDNIDPKNEDVVHEYFENKIDWQILIKEAGVLKDSLNKIKYLLSLGIYDIKILTTVTSMLEPIHKTNYFNDVLPEVEVITVPWGVRKDKVVYARNSILVDDSKTNIFNWRDSDGIGLHFVKENPNWDMMEIDNLLDIPRFNDNVKTYSKRLTR